MPIYEYRCTSCGHELEALQRFSDAPLMTCPACGQATLMKRVSAAGFQLKGSGWYVTDFKASGAKPAAKKQDGDASTETKAEGKDESKAASTPESKTETKGAATTEAKAGGAASKPESGSSSTTT